MGRLGVPLLVASLASLLGCGQAATASHGAVPGALPDESRRVVVHRSGVAYFERETLVRGRSLYLIVPRRHLSDVLGSLSARDLDSNELATVSYRSRTPDAVDLSVSWSGAGPHRARLSYVTESPAWKPSYRLRLDGERRAALEAWAIVDNASGEDWNDVRLGVSSMAPSVLRRDLTSLRFQEGSWAMRSATVARASCGDSCMVMHVADDVVSAVARRLSPKGSRSLQERALEAERRIGRFAAAARRDGDRIRSVCLQDNLAQLALVRRAPPKQRPGVVRVLHERIDVLLQEAVNCLGTEAPYVDFMGSAHAPQTGAMGGRVDPVGPDDRLRPDPHTLGARVAALTELTRELVDRVRLNDARVRLVAAPGDARVELVKDLLLTAGMSEARIAIEHRATVAQRGGLVLVLEPVPQGSPRVPRTALDLGDSRSVSFESRTPVSVPSGGSVMLALYSGRTSADLVSFYDTGDPRASQRHPFRAIRFHNPTDAPLEGGPVVVTKAGRYLGAGDCDSIPPRGEGFVPLGVDPSGYVNRSVERQESVARVLRAQGDVLTVDVQSTILTHLELHNRRPEALTVYVRHVPRLGYVLESPDPSVDMGDAKLFAVSLPASGSSKLDIAERSVRRETGTRRAFPAQWFESSAAESTSP